MNSLPTPAPTVFIIDDHSDELRVVAEHCRSIGFPVESCSSPASMLSLISKQTRGCVISDYLMPQMSSLKLQGKLRQLGVELPIIVVAQHADVRTCRTALQNGIFDFVEKSFHPHELLDVIQRAMQQNEEEFVERRIRDTFLDKLSRVSPREKDVMYQLSGGKSLKEIAAAFEISVQTASKHRGSLFQKLGIQNEVELLRLLIAVDPNHGCGASFTAA